MQLFKMFYKYTLIFENLKRKGKKTISQIHIITSNKISVDTKPHR